MKGFAAAGLALAVLLCTGCASVTQGTTHNLRIETITEKGEQLDGADCTLNNDQGTAIAKSGSSTLVRRSSKDLEISCAAAGQADAKGRLVSRANAGLAGNIILGGAVGAVIDHNTGAAYTYPSWVRLVFGQFNVYDRRDEHDGTAMMPAGAVLTQGPAVQIATTPAAPIERRRVARGDTFDYRLTDRTTGRQQTVVLRAERVQGNEISFNGGARVEGGNGEVRIASALIGELDGVTPPQGWMPGGRAPSGSLTLKYRSIVPGSTLSYELDATAEGEQKMVIDGKELRTIRVGLRGWAESNNGNVTGRAQYNGTVWLSPELGRPVRYEVTSRTTGNSAANIRIDEVAELVRIGRD